MRRLSRVLALRLLGLGVLALIAGALFCGCERNGAGSYDLGSAPAGHVRCEGTPAGGLRCRSE